MQYRVDIRTPDSNGWVFGSIATTALEAMTFCKLIRESYPTWVVRTSRLDNVQPDVLITLSAGDRLCDTQLAPTACAETLDAQLNIITSGTGGVRPSS
jgi:hypothetical protein